MNEEVVKRIVPHRLTAIDLNCLRQADDACFYLNTEGIPAYPEDEAGIKLVKRGAYDDPFSQDKYHFIPCKMYLDRVTGFKDATVGFEMIHAGKYNDNWQTIIGVMKPGDVITLEWRPDYHQNGYMQKAEPVLHGDALYLVVTRQLKRGQKRMSFLISAQCCPNNTARMIKPKEV